MSDLLRAMGIVEVAFTGTRKGMTYLQKGLVKGILAIHNPVKVHHGDCIGSDFDFHTIARRLGFHVVLHPPDNPKQRAYCSFDELRPEADYLVRDRQMVDECNLLIGTPGEYKNIMRGSGTWYTLRYARKQEKPFIIVFPDGTIKENNFE